jgi:hypothetical protein
VTDVDGANKDLSNRVGFARARKDDREGRMLRIDCRVKVEDRNDPRSLAGRYPYS